MRAARWHSVALPLVYLAEHPASALLEVLVHMEVDGDDLPDFYQLLAIDIPDGTAFDDVPALSPDWRADPPETQQIGNQWLAEAATALLRVPSAIVPHTWNWLLNPRHAGAQAARVAEIVHARFDPRLFD